MTAADLMCSLNRAVALGFSLCINFLIYYSSFLETFSYKLKEHSEENSIRYLPIG